MIRPDITFRAVVLGAPDAHQLGEFYHRLLGWDIADDAEPGWYRLRSPTGGGLSFQTEPDHVAPVWPAEPGRQQMMMHLDLLVADLGAACAHAEACGARPAQHQPMPDIRVYLDPAGHPFCLFLPGA